MEKKSGKTVYNGSAIGKLLYLERREQIVKREHVEDKEKELLRFEAACREAGEQLRLLYEEALKKVGESQAEIFETHRMMLEDEDFLSAVRNMIEGQGMNAEYAAAVTGDNFSKMFSEMEDDYMKSRAADIKDISERLIRVLSGEGEQSLQMPEPVIIAAQDLSPSETLRLDKSKVLAFVTQYGSANSHTAILARTMNIPALTGVDIDPEWNGKLAAVDGKNGCIYIEPDETVVGNIKEEQKKAQELDKMLQQLKGKPTQTKTGRKINLYANIGSIGDAGLAIINDAEGIGLFRSEFLYLERTDFPTEEEQFQAYRTVAQTMAGRKVIIRTLDIGADKQAGYFGLEPEENPAMGYRAVRICLDRTDLFKTQLRAVFRASAYGNIAVMYPMIISVNEVRQIKKIVGEVKEELTKQGIPYSDVEQGIMIETPAAAVISDLLAPEVDFFSIGTNDLTQYTLAIDRQNSKLDAIYEPHHEAVLRLIRMTVEHAHQAGIWAGICGELAGDITLTEEFIKMGVDELSVSPPMILKVRRAVNECG